MLSWRSVQDSTNLGEFGVKKFSKYDEGKKVILGKATTTIHASGDHVLAWLWNYCSYNRIKTHMKMEGGSTVRQYYEPDKATHTFFPEEVSKRTFGGNENQNERIQHTVKHINLPHANTRAVNVAMVWGNLKEGGGDSSANVAPSPTHNHNNNNNSNNEVLVLGFQPADTRYTGPIKKKAKTNAISGILRTGGSNISIQKLYSRAVILSTGSGKIEVSEL